MSLLFFKLVLRHLGYASAVLLGLACLAERLAPGSVLSYVPLWPLVLLTLVIQLCALAVISSGGRAVHEAQRVLLFGGGTAFVVFLALIVRETGTKGLALSFLALVLLVLTTLALSSPSRREEE